MISPWPFPRFWAPVARLIWQTRVAARAPLRRRVDRTEVEGRFNLLLVVRAFRRRAFPLLGVELGHSGTCNFKEQRRGLRQVQAWIPAAARVIVIGDREFRSTPLARWMGKQGWGYVLRLKANTGLELRPGIGSRVGDLSLSWGQKRGFESVRVSRSSQSRFGPVNLAWIGEEREEAPWYLMTNVATLGQAQCLFAVRGWCEPV